MRRCCEKCTTPSWRCTWWRESWFAPRRGGSSRSGKASPTCCCTKTRSEASCGGGCSEANDQHHRCLPKMTAFVAGVVAGILVAARGGQLGPRARPERRTDGARLRLASTDTVDSLAVARVVQK